jgi:hypothetical protein
MVALGCDRLPWQLRNRVKAQQKAAETAEIKSRIRTTIRSARDTLQNNRHNVTLSLNPNEYGENNRNINRHCYGYKRNEALCGFPVVDGQLGWPRVNRGER